VYSDKRLLLLYPLFGIGAFVLLSFVHDSFRTDRGIETYYLPMTVGFTVGSIIAYFRYAIETRTRRYERQLSKEREDAVLGRAAATIAHEVRNPLNALGMGLQRLQIEAEELRPEHRQLLDLMLNSVHRANGIIETLLRYTRPPRPRRQPLNLGAIVRELLMLYQSQCDELGIEVRQTIPVIEPISGDPDLMRQVIENLIRNAIEAQREGGYLEVELKGTPQEIVLSFRNAGFPLPPDEAEQIFEPYFTTKAQGTGLGASIARRIVMAHGGRMEVHAKGEGEVEISVTLPLTHETLQIPDGKEGQFFDENPRRG
jgi:two-component system, NtrC family, sensor histidine kinase HydH